MEADLYPRYRSELAELIEGSLGELSPFHQTFGYRADGVSPNTACCRAAGTRDLCRSRMRTPMARLGGVSSRTTWPSASWRLVAKKTSGMSPHFYSSRW